MARSLSSQKRVRQNEKRRIRNKSRKSALKTQVKKLADAVAARQTETAEKEYRQTARLLDRIAAKGTIHRRTAARRKSRLARQVNAMTRSAAAGK